MEGMTSSQKKKVTIKSDDWFINKALVQANTFVQSPNFGTESTQFYWRAERSAYHDSYNLYMYLAACSEERIFVKGKFWFGDRSPINNYTINCTVSLDKKEKIVYENWSNDRHIMSELTFEEVEPALIKVSQLEHYKSLSSQFQSLRLNSANFADITLITTADQREFPVHKCILSTRSTVFATMFSNETFTENQNRQVKIDDVNGETMDALLDYLYSGNVGEIHQTAGNLLQAADKYDIPLLVKACVHSMIAHVSVENAAQFFYLADLHQLEEAKKEIVEFIRKNRQAVRNSSGWKEFIGLEQMQQFFDLKV